MWCQQSGNSEGNSKRTYCVQRCDFGHVPLAEIRIELASIIKRAHDVRCAVSNPATAKATQKELTVYNVVTWTRPTC